MGSRIVIDARKLGDGGIGVYIENLVDGLLELRSAGRSDSEFTLLIAPALKQSLIANPSHPLQRWSADVQMAVEPAKKYSLSELLLLAHRQRRVLEKANVFHTPHFTLPFFCPVPTVVTIHDLIHASHPDTFLHSVVTPQLVRSSMRRGTHLITVSEASRDALFALAPKYSKPISVIPNALRRGIAPALPAEVKNYLQSEGITQPYLLFVGPDREHKGLKFLLQALHSVRSRMSEYANLGLVLVCSNVSAASHELISSLGLAGSVTIKREVDVQQLSSYYSGAAAAVIPSLAEGFGLVGLEAMACGAPLVCTPVPSVKEVCADAAWYADSFNSEQLANVLERALADSTERQHRVLLGRERARRFARRQVAEQTLRVYEMAMEQRGASPLVSPEWGMIKTDGDSAGKLAEQIEGRG